MSAVSRRKLLQGAGVAGLGLLAGCGLLPGRTPEPPPQVARSGYVGPTVGLPPLTRALAELGYVEGRNLILESRDFRVVGRASGGSARKKQPSCSVCSLTCSSGATRVSFARCSR